MTTTDGSCKRTYTFRLNIDQGQVAGRLITRSGGTAEITGTVDEDGKAELAGHGGHNLKIIGAFEDEKTEGTWTTKLCSGIFKSKRKS